MTLEQNDTLRSRLEGPARKVSMALQDWAVYSEFPDRDCAMLSYVAQRLLVDFDINVEVRAGFAAWRVGPAEFEVLGYYSEPWEMDFSLGHAWVEYGPLILDFSTFQIVRKVRALDAEVNQKTAILWNPPEFLIASREEIRSFDDVRNGTHPGLFYYERRRESEALLRNKLDTAALEANVRMARNLQGKVK